MGPETMAADNTEKEVLVHWSARKMPPIIALYVAAVFLAMMLVSYFVLHSGAAVKALAIAAVGSIVAVIPGLFSRVDYRLNERGLEKRASNTKEPGSFENVFQLDQLSHVVPMRHGFKYYRFLDEANAFRRFWKLHVSDEFSGEVHVERTDQRRVLEILNEHGIPCR